MARKDVLTSWDRDNRNNMQDNFIELYGVVNDIVGTITDEVYEQIIDGSKLDWKEPVDSFADLPTGAVEGETRMTRERGIIYRFNGTEWKEIQEIDATAINEVDSRLSSQLSQTVINVNELGINASNFSSIQSAIDSLGTSGGKVNVPYKTFEIDEPISFDSNNIELVGIGKPKISPSASFSGSSIFKSLMSERVNVPGSIEGIIIDNFDLDGKGKANAFEFSRLTRGSRLSNNKIINVINGMQISDSWSFSIHNNNLNVASGNGIGLEGAVNAVDVRGNVIRNAETGLKVTGSNGSSISGNTFELNDYNVNFAGFGNNINGNYFELPNIENVLLGNSNTKFSGNVIGGNFYDNTGVSKSGNFMVNVENNSFLANYFRNIIYMFYLTSDSFVENNEFFLPIIEGTTPFRKEGTSSVGGDILGGNNVVYRGQTTSINTNKTGSGNSTADWRINTPDGNFSRIGKVSSNNDDFVFMGDGVAGFEFRKPVALRGDVEFSAGQKLGFYGNDPITRRGVSGVSADQKIDSLISALKEYGLLSP